MITLFPNLQISTSHSQKHEIITRTFILERLTTYQMDIIQAQVYLDDEFANILQGIEKIGNPQKINYFIFDGLKSLYVSIDEVRRENQFTVPKRFAETQFILIKYQKKREQKVMQQYIQKEDYIIDFLQSDYQISEMKEQNIQKNETKNLQGLNMDIQQQKQTRSKQRTIKQSLLLVKRWRDIFKSSINSKRKKINFQQAAEIIGISKKSLDDYFLQLRAGQYYGFKFQDHLEDGIGVLRRFIKQNQNKNKSKSVKYPRHLKLFEKQFSKINNLKVIQIENQQMKKLSIQKEVTAASLSVKDKNENIQKSVSIEEDDQRQAMLFNDFSALLEEQSIQQIQNQYYKNFKLLNDQPNDPLYQFEQVLYKNCGCDKFKEMDIFDISQ